jgi:hypothetical protein
MSTGSFAEILREKIEKNSKSAFQSSTTVDNNSGSFTPSESIELSQLRTRLFEHSPNSFHVSQPKMSETPYHKFQTQKRYINDDKTWAKTVHSKAKSAAEPAKLSPRPKGVAHKLNEKQTASMSYFINEKQFLLEDFTQDELKKAYRKLALLKHPDRTNGSATSFLELKKHFEVLSTVFKK